MDIDFGVDSNIIKIDDDSAKSKTMAVSDLPEPPARLSEEAKAHWRSVGEDMMNADLLGKVDLSSFGRYCEAFIGYSHAQRECDEKGIYQTTPNGYMQLAPWKVARDRFSDELTKLETKLMINPLSRRGAKVKPAQENLDLD